MPGWSRFTRVGLALAATLVVAGVVLFATLGRSSPEHARGVAAAQRSGDDEPYGPPGLARYAEQAPHVASMLNVYGVQGGVRGAAPTPPPSIAPVSAAAFNAPVAMYRSFSSRQLGLMANDVSQLESALAAGERSGAEGAWRAAFADYLKLGAVYLEGQVADLDQAIDGTPGGLAGGTASPQFSGLHRLEFGLWTGASLSSLQPWARRLATDVSRLRHVLPRVEISPLDYATRAHEILEDAVRDLLSGMDVPWSREGVLGTDAGLGATSEVIRTLVPLLKNREGVLPVVSQELDRLRSTLAAIKVAHGGSLPSNDELTRAQSERLDAAIGQALEALAQVPGALETVTTARIPQIPSTAASLAR
jgi:hypothetical protein